MFSGLFAIIQVMSILLYLFFEIPLANVWGHLYKKLRGQPRPRRPQGVNQKEVNLQHPEKKSIKSEKSDSVSEPHQSDTVSHNTEL